MSDGNISSERKRQLIKDLMAAYADTDGEYLQSLYFPETAASCRIPSKFGVPSAVFKQRFHFYVNTGDNGEGMVGFCPQDTTFMSVFAHLDSIRSSDDDNVT